jgi:hypothetical protein
MEDDIDLGEGFRVPEVSRAVKHGDDELSGVHNVSGPVRRVVEGFTEAVGSLLNREGRNRTKLDNLEARLQCADVVLDPSIMLDDIVKNADFIREVLGSKPSMVSLSLFRAMSAVFSQCIRRKRPCCIKNEDLRECEEDIGLFEMAHQGEMADELFRIGNRLIDAYESMAKEFARNAASELDLT